MSETLSNLENCIKTSNYKKFYNLIMKNKSMVNDRDDQNFTLLMIACKNMDWQTRNIESNFKILRTLIKLGADVNAVRYYESERFNNRKEKDTALTYACTICTSGLVKYLVENGADTNFQDNYGYTPLMTCFTYRIFNLEIVNYLMQKTDLNLKNNKGKNLLMMLCDKGKTINLLELIKNPKVDIDPKHDYGKYDNIVKREYLNRKRNLEKLYLIAKKENSILGSLPREIFKEISGLIY